MNVLAKIVKEVILIPYRVVQGGAAAIDEVIDGPQEKKK